MIFSIFAVVLGVAFATNSPILLDPDCAGALDPRARLEAQLEHLMLAELRDVTLARDQLTASVVRRRIFPTTYSPMHLNLLDPSAPASGATPTWIQRKLGLVLDSARRFDRRNVSILNQLSNVPLKDRALWIRYFLLVHPTVRLSAEDLADITRILFGNGPSRERSPVWQIDLRTPGIRNELRYETLRTLMDFLSDHWDQKTSESVPDFHAVLTKALESINAGSSRFDRILAEDYASGLLDDHPDIVKYFESRADFEHLVTVILAKDAKANERSAALLSTVNRPLSFPNFAAMLMLEINGAVSDRDVSLETKRQLMRAIGWLGDQAGRLDHAIVRFIEVAPLPDALHALRELGQRTRIFGRDVIKAFLNKSSQDPTSFREGIEIFAPERAVGEVLSEDAWVEVEGHLPALMRQSTDVDWDRWALDLAWKRSLSDHLNLQTTMTALFREKHREDWARDFVLDFYVRDPRLDLTEYLRNTEFEGRPLPIESLRTYLTRSAGHPHYRAAVIRAAGTNLLRDPDAPRALVDEYVNLAPEMAEERPRLAGAALFAADDRLAPRLLARALRHPEDADREMGAQPAVRLAFGAPPGGLSWMALIRRMPRSRRHDFVKDLLHVHRTSTSGLTDIIASLDPVEGVREAVTEFLSSSSKMTSGETDFSQDQILAMFGRGRLRQFFPRISRTELPDGWTTSAALILAVRSAQPGALNKRWLARAAALPTGRRGVDAVFGYRPAVNHADLRSQLAADLRLDGGLEAEQVRGLVVQGNYEKRGHSIMQGETDRGASQIENDADGINYLVERALREQYLQNERHLVRRLFTSLWTLNAQDDLIEMMRQRAVVIYQHHRDFYDLRVEAHNFPNQDTLARIKAFGRRLDLQDPMRAEIETLTGEIVRILERGRRASESLTATLNDLPGSDYVRRILEKQFAELWREPLAQRLFSLASLRKRWRKERAEEKRIYGTLENIDTLLGEETLADFVQMNVAFEIEATPAPKTVAEVGTFGRTIQGLLEHVVLDDLLTSAQGHRLHAQVDEILAAGDLDVPQKIDALVRVIQSAIDQSRQTLEVEFGRFDRVLGNVVPRLAHAPEPFVDDVLRSSNVLMLSRLAERVQKPVEIFNPGRVTGVLRLNPDLSRLGAEDIPLFTALPPQIDPVAGVLTLAVGSRLSHLQLLSRSLGIPNVKIDSKFRDSIAHLDGRRVELIATAEGKFTLTEASEGALRARAPSPTLVLPRPDRTVTRPITLSRAGRLAASNFAGPKSLNLARLMNDPDMAALVPDGVILPFGFFNRFVGAARLRPILRTLRLLNLENASLVARIAYSVRQMIETTPIPPEMLAEIKAEVLALNLNSSQGLFVRSDTNVEDLDNFNGAGLNLSVANVSQDDQALDVAIRRVWASAFTERAISWRAKAMHSPIVVMAEPSVLIQPTVEAESSGVITSRGTAEWIAGRGLLSADRGIAAVVEAETGVEEWTFASGVARRISCSLSRHRNVTDPAGGLRQIDACPDETVLTPAQADRLNERAMHIERVLGDRPHGWDIEWAFERNTLRILQARPNF